MEIDDNQRPVNVTNCDRENQNIVRMMQCFHSSIQCGPEYVCICCDQLWYRSSVKKCVPQTYSNCTSNIVNSCVTGVKRVDSIEWICLACNSNLKSGRLPSCAKANKMY